MDPVGAALLGAALADHSSTRARVTLSDLVDRSSVNLLGDMDVSRTCVHCGKVVAADRMLRCNHCGEFFRALEDRPAIEAPRAEGPVVRSGRRVVVGLVVALAIPVSFALLAWLVDRGIAPYDPLKPLLAPLGYISFLELILGPLGLLIAGRGARIRDAIVWLAVFVVGLPALVVLSLFAVVSLSGALGEPF